MLKSIENKLQISTKNVPWVRSGSNWHGRTAGLNERVVVPSVNQGCHTGGEDRRLEMYLLKLVSFGRRAVAPGFLQRLVSGL